jgi:4-amino-4-deoxy-L-arabinose transferase-like glycosyltransferase
MARQIAVAPSGTFPSLTRTAWIRRRPAIGAAALRDAAGLVGLLLLMYACSLYRLSSVVISDMDEGTYIYAGKLLAGGAVPYRDFLLAHPPLAILLTGAWQWLFGSEIMPIRLAYLALVLASTVSLYAIGRALSRSHLGGLLCVATYMAGMLFLANMGRTVRLEPLMNAFLLAAVALYLWRPDSARTRAVVGALLAGAVLVKLVAVVPAGFIFLADALWMRPGRQFVRSWLAAGAGAAAVLVPAAAVLLSQPGFLDDVLRSQVDRPGLPLHTRLYFLRQASVRYPVVPVALAAAAWFVFRARDPRLRVVSLVALGSAVTLVAVFRTFFGYYLVQVLPWTAAVFGVVAVGALRAVAGRWHRALLVAATLTLGGLAPLAYAEVYYRTAHDHVSGPQAIVAQLEGGEGYLYSMYPSFALWSHREPYPWPYAADSLIPRITGRIGDQDLVGVFSGSQALVLWPGELADYPLARAYVERTFRLAYEDDSWALWVR